MASARTSDHHPIPMQATRRGPALTTFALPRHSLPADGLRTAYFQLARSTPRPPLRCANRSPSRRRSPRRRRSLAVDQHRHAALHSGPSLRSGGERKADRMAHVEVLTGRALARWSGAGSRRRTPPWWCRCARYGSGRRPCVRAGSCARRHPRSRRRWRSRPGRHVDGRRHDLLRALMCEALALGDVHSGSSRAREGYVDCASAHYRHQAIFILIGWCRSSRIEKTAA